MEEWRQDALSVIQSGVLSEQGLKDLTASLLSSSGRAGDIVRKYLDPEYICAQLEEYILVMIDFFQNPEEYWDRFCS